MRADPDFDNHEQLISIRDEPTGLEALIAIHSTVLGPAAGGCRVARYASRSAAVTDALRLSRGMTYKNALAGLPAGGGKAVIYGFDPKAPRTSVFEAFGRAVDALKGHYITAEDVGTSIADMEAVSRATAYVAGLPTRVGRAGGDPSPWTALGVFLALESAIDRPLAGARVAVQGLGAVGFKLCERLHQAGVRLVVSDVDQSRTAAAKRAFDAEVAAPDRISSVEADVFSPNALGAVLNAETISELQAPLVCGGANNQLASAEDGNRLFGRSITYVPDYVANAGGIINVMAEYLGEPGDAVETRVREIGPRTKTILARAGAQQRPAHEVADEMARQLFAARSVVHS